MKHLIAFLMCLCMLSIGAIQAKESKVSEQPKIEQTCIDVGCVQQVEVIQLNQVPDVGQMVTDNYTIKQSYEQSNKQIFQKDALCSQFRFVPDCPIEFIGKHKTKYITHYAYNSCHPYNQPPSK